ncbi:hypothetical protein VTH82DRAFT_5127 [Thermothelomyces myriococcoides]
MAFANITTASSSSSSSSSSQGKRLICAGNMIDEPKPTQTTASRALQPPHPEANRCTRMAQALESTCWAPAHKEQTTSVQAKRSCNIPLQFGKLLLPRAALPPPPGRASTINLRS